MECLWYLMKPTLLPKLFTSKALKFIFQKSVALIQPSSSKVDGLFPTYFSPALFNTAIFYIQGLFFYFIFFLGSVGICTCSFSSHQLQRHPDLNPSLPQPHVFPQRHGPGEWVGGVRGQTT